MSNGSTSTKKRLAVCADDFALNRAIDAAVIDLVDDGRITAVSVMVESPEWPRAALELVAAARNKADIGLHLSLTTPYADPSAFGAVNLFLVLARLYWSGADIRSELARQFDRFEDAVGRAPDFIDGHQHVHQLPRVREALLDIVKIRYHAAPDKGPWLRSTRPPARRPGAEIALQSRLKSKLIYLMGGAAFDRLLAEIGLCANTAFAGIYGFDGDQAGWVNQLLNWVRELPDGGLLSCHPAVARSDSDPIAAARLCEYRALKSGALEAALMEAGAQLVRQSVLAHG